MNTSLRISIEVELTEPVSGRIGVLGADPAPFTGWLEMHSAIERACANARAAEADQGDGRQGGDL